MRIELTAAAAVFLACTGAALADEGPIKIGAVAAVTGPLNFSEIPNAAAAVFDKVNAEGGVQGRQIEYIIEDDRTDPNVSAQSARRLVDQENVVGMAGSASLLECAVNTGYYARKNIYSVNGLGVDPACFVAANNAPVNTGPYVGAAITMKYAAQELGHRKLCMTALALPIQDPGWDWLRGYMKDELGLEMHYFSNSMQPTDDVTPYVLQAREQGCEAMLMSMLEPHTIAWLNVAKTQGVDDVQWLFLTSGYTDAVAEAVGASGDGAIFNVEFEPYLSDADELAAWRELMDSAGLPRSSFSQGGYVAAKTMVAALESIKGEITRESVQEALLNVSYYTPLVGTRIEVSSEAPNTPNTTSKFVTLENGEWITVTEDWVPLYGKN